MRRNAKQRRGEHRQLRSVGGAHRRRGASLAQIR